MQVTARQSAASGPGFGVKKPECEAGFCPGSLDNPELPQPLDALYNNIPGYVHVRVHVYVCAYVRVYVHVYVCG